MKNTLPLLLLLIFCWSCKTKQKAIPVLLTDPSAADCTQFPKDDFRYVYLGRVDIPIETEYMQLSEWRYACTYSSLYVAKGMYDRFGKWDDVIVDPKRPRDPLLVWRAKSLFSDDPKKYTVVAHGRETEDKVYTAVLVLDTQNEEVLPRISGAEQSKFLGYFAQLIRENDRKGERFYDVYYASFPKS